ncbi:hypothetical protein BCR33DRAFT_18575 [Rhizoclosmatium globosum]|uniref:Uncharacterized protein n=1 Tax=Rhizoclosmatium globosum TaxID=329046 RepID=A0A1Y2CQ02_9FUNG|nr:hypothetical protein BCR33DRAFT_18575 [Rhizoclosmatium globosum]|eukprot:ORY49092.1 hypothetical protein BCR33DRAFT_18575 [Rhizoclosmatium globosum]
MFAKRRKAIPVDEPQNHAVTVQQTSLAWILSIPFIEALVTASRLSRTCKHLNVVVNQHFESLRFVNLLFEHIESDIATASQWLPPTQLPQWILEHKSHIRQNDILRDTVLNQVYHAIEPTYRTNLLHSLPTQYPFLKHFRYIQFCEDEHAWRDDTIDAEFRIPTTGLPKAAENLAGGILRFTCYFTEYTTMIEMAIPRSNQLGHIIPFSNPQDLCTEVPEDLSQRELRHIFAHCPTTANKLFPYFPYQIMNLKDGFCRNFMRAFDGLLSLLGWHSFSTIEFIACCFGGIACFDHVGPDGDAYEFGRKTLFPLELPCIEWMRTSKLGKRVLGEEGEVGFAKKLRKRVEKIHRDFLFRVYGQALFEAHVTDLRFAGRSQDVNVQDVKETVARRTRSKWRHGDKFYQLENLEDEEEEIFDHDDEGMSESDSETGMTYEEEEEDIVFRTSFFRLLFQHTDSTTCYEIHTHNKGYDDVDGDDNDNENEVTEESIRNDRSYTLVSDTIISLSPESTINLSVRIEAPTITDGKFTTRPTLSVSIIHHTFKSKGTKRLMSYFELIKPNGPQMEAIVLKLLHASGLESNLSVQDMCCLFMQFLIISAVAGHIANCRIYPRTFMLEKVLAYREYLNIHGYADTAVLAKGEFVVEDCMTDLEGKAEDPAGMIGIAMDVLFKMIEKAV